MRTEPGPTSPAARVLPGLTGLRGVAALMVIVGHLDLTHGQGRVQRFGGPLAQLGVQVFFVLSGFLITTLVLREEASRGGRVSLGRFYARRALRLLPPFYLFLLGVSVLTAVGLLHLTVADLRHAALHVWNYTGSDAVPLNHVWSLDVEEHFYLVYPPLFVLLARRRLVGLCTAIVVASPLVRVVSYVAMPGIRDVVMQQTHSRLDALLLGCLLALRWRSPAVRRLAGWASTPAVQVAVPVALLLVLAVQVKLGLPFMVVAGFSLQALLVAAWVAGLQHRPTASRRLLDSRLLVHVGTISYTLYLWQQIFTLPGSSVPWLTSVPLAVVAPLLIAEVSWRVMERPLRDVRRRLA